MKVLTVVGAWWVERGFDAALDDADEMAINVDAIVAVRGGGDWPECSVIDTSDGNAVIVKETFQSVVSRLSVL